MANPRCTKCGGTGMTHNGGTPKRQIACPQEGCGTWTHDPTPQEVVTALEKGLEQARAAVEGLERQLQAARDHVATLCQACNGTKLVTLGGAQHPCPACASKASCAACNGAGKVVLAEKEYPCPAACVASKGAV